MVTEVTKTLISKGVISIPELPLSSVFIVGRALLLPARLVEKRQIDNAWCECPLMLETIKQNNNNVRPFLIQLCHYLSSGEAIWYDLSAVMIFLLFFSITNQVYVVPVASLVTLQKPQSLLINFVGEPIGMPDDKLNGGIRWYTMTKDRRPCTGLGPNRDFQDGNK